MLRIVYVVHLDHLEAAVLCGGVQRGVADVGDGVDVHVVVVEQDVHL